MRLLIAALGAALVMACGSGKKPDEQAFLNSLDSANNQAGPSVDDQMIEDILQQIPSPLEISVLLKESGTKYNASLLNSPENLSKYNNNYKMALNLGIYGADLGYTNIYQQNQDGIKYLRSIESLAEGLNIGQFFDIQTIGRLAANSNNLDSLLLMTTQNFNTINDYLQTQGRASLSVLLLTGGWLEAMHIICQMAVKNPTNTVLAEAIGEQKVILERVVLLLSLASKEDENMASLLSDVKGLEQAYSPVVLTYTYKESKVEIIDGVAVVKDNSSTSITITPADVTRIADITRSVRSKIIS